MALAHGGEIVFLVFGAIAGVAAAFGLIGGVVCKKCGVSAWRGCGITYGTFLAALALGVVSLALSDTRSSREDLLEVSFMLVLFGGVLGAPALGMGYLLTRSLIRSPRTRT